MTDKAKEIKEIYSQRGTICSYCNANDWYCPSDCKLIEKAKELSDKQWEDIAKKYNIEDYYEIMMSIKTKKRPKEMLKYDKHR